jgi:hypothetical protein
MLIPIKIPGLCALGRETERERAERARVCVCGTGCRGTGVSGYRGAGVPGSAGSAVEGGDGAGGGWGEGLCAVSLTAAAAPAF